MNTRTLATLALGGCLCAGLAAPAFAQPMAVPSGNGPIVNKEGLSAAGTGGANGVALGARGAGTGTNIRQPANRASSANLAPTTPPSSAGAPPAPATPTPR